MFLSLLAVALERLGSLELAPRCLATVRRDDCCPRFTVLRADAGRTAGDLPGSACRAHQAQKPRAWLGSAILLSCGLRLH